MSKHMSADEKLGVNPAGKLKLRRSIVNLPKGSGPLKRTNSNNQYK
ncbi:hypothetical protein KW801_03535 [Candidatus Saccharibacteria bacterium]|nr:hypothetical protein [Candidatus Saccharibacteria bacterium]